MPSLSLSCKLVSSPEGVPRQRPWNLRLGHALCGLEHGAEEEGGGDCQQRLCAICPSDVLASEEDAVHRPGPRGVGAGHLRVRRNRVLRQSGAAGRGGALVQRDARAHQDALSWEYRVLHQEFRYLTKEDWTFWSYIAWARLARSRMDLLIPYQCIDVEAMTWNARCSRYAPVTEYWRAIGCPRYFIAEIPLTYLISCFKDDHNNGWRALAYTEYISRQAVFVLWGAYENYCVWRLTAEARTRLLSFDLGERLGSPRNQKELLPMLEVM